MPAPASPRSPSSSRAASAARSIPGITTTRSLVFRGHLRRARAQGHELPAVHRLHSRRRRRAAHADRACAPASAVKPGEPITTRVTTLRVAAGTLARRRSPAARGERLLRSEPQRRALHRRRADDGAARRRPRRARRRAADGPRQRDAPRPRPPESAPRCRSTRSVRDEVRLAAGAARAPDRAARGARLPGARAAARPLRGPLHEHRGARRGRGRRAALAALRPAGARGVRADLRPRRARPARGPACPSPASRRRSR